MIIIEGDELKVKVMNCNVNEPNITYTRTLIQYSTASLSRSSKYNWYTKDKNSPQSHMQKFVGISMFFLAAPAAADQPNILFVQKFCVISPRKLMMVFAESQTCWRS